MTDWNGNGGGWGGDAPVFDTNGIYEWGGKVWDYPDVWITVQRCEATATSTGRDCIWHYTPDDDPEGWDALAYGGGYYDEGMDCVDEILHEKRILCFQACELLYLHASAKGNRVADMCLGYLYSYDRCEGQYWHVREHPFDPDKRAYEHLKQAAEAGIAEACYKLGDLVRDGRGCEPDLAYAFELFKRAFELGQKQAPRLWGSAALRLGSAYEEGEGCVQSFVDAEHWYEIASTGLGIAVRAGDGWYRGALRRAERGLKRVRQELSGEY